MDKWSGHRTTARTVSRRSISRLKPHQIVLMCIVHVLLHSLNNTHLHTYCSAQLTLTLNCKHHLQYIGFSIEIRSRLGIARSALTFMNNLWKDQALNKETNVRLMKALGCESWTLKASDKKRIAGFEMTAYRRMLKISWKDYRT